MKKDKIIDLVFVFIVTFLSCWFFWEAIAKSHIDNYIDENYGNAIIETKNNSNLIIELIDDDS